MRTASSTIGAACSRAPSPSAAAIVCTVMPVDIPTAATTPATRPRAIPLAMMNIMSGPGTRLMTAQATAKATSIEASMVPIQAAGRPEARRFHMLDGSVGDLCLVQQLLGLAVVEQQAALVGHGRHRGAH